ncbi:MAG: outer membrane protein transport protein, partial [Hyphomicrobium sp.]
MMRTKAVCVFAALGFMSQIEHASAGGFYSPYQSATAIGTAFAGASVRTDDVGFFLYNPAVISSFSKAQTFSDVRGFAPSARIVPTQALSPAGTNLTSNGDSGNMTDLAAAPGSVTVIPLGHGLTAGLGSSAPFATAVETDSGWGGRFHLKKAYMVGMNATGAVSWQPASWISVAGGLQVQRFETRFENSALVPTGPASAVEATAFMKGRDWGLGGVAGVVLKPLPTTSVGLAWRSAMTHDIHGKVGAKLPGIPVERVSYDIDLPQTITAGLEHR